MPMVLKVPLGAGGLLPLDTWDQHPELDSSWTDGCLCPQRVERPLEEDSRTAAAVFSIPLKSRGM